MDIVQLLPIVINLGTLAVGGLWALSKIDSRLQILNNDQKTASMKMADISQSFSQRISETNTTITDRMSKMEGKLDQLGTAFVQFARQETRIDGQDKRLDGQDTRLQELSERIDEYNRLLAEALAGHKPKVKRRA